MSHREPTATEEPTIGKLVVDASRDFSSLIQHEIALAKSELKLSVKAGGIGVAMFAAAGFLVLLAIIMISVAFAYFLHFTGLDLAWCFLIVFAAYIAWPACWCWSACARPRRSARPSARSSRPARSRGR